MLGVEGFGEEARSKDRLRVGDLPDAVARLRFDGVADEEVPEGLIEDFSVDDLELRDCSRAAEASISRVAALSVVVLMPLTAAAKDAIIDCCFGLAEDLDFLSFVPEGIGE